MVFNEIYSAYYNAVANVINRLLQGEKGDEVLYSAVNELAFEETALYLIPNLKNGNWQLIDSKGESVIKNKPTMPLTTIQLEWLKALSLDKRVKLFDVDFSFLEGVKPLFTADDYLVFDKYCDGDPYDDENYVLNFKKILSAINGKYTVTVEYKTRKGLKTKMNFEPYKLEYSVKDDKFRVSTQNALRFINMARIISVEKCNKKARKRNNLSSELKTVSMVIFNKRNSLERVMLHFAHFEKQAVKTDDGNYLLTLKYDVNDEPEVVIRILSFGPFVKVVEPESFVNLIKTRLIQQINRKIK